MNNKKLVELIVKKEAGKSSVSVGDVREIVGIISDLVVKDVSVIEFLIKNGLRRKK